MSESGQAQERTEAPTPRRLEQARKKGQVARSRELNTMSVMLAGAAGLLALGPFMAEDLRQILIRGLSLEKQGTFAADDAVQVLLTPIFEAAVALAPFFGLLLVAALAGPAALGGLVFSVEAATPKLERLSPLKGLKRIFSMQGLMELGKTLLKFAVLSGVAAVLLWSIADDLLHLGRQSPLEGLAGAGKLIQLAFIVLAIGLVVVAAVDVPFQIWNHVRQLRMTRQEIKDEYKETEGSPEVRAKVRRMQQEVAGRRMMTEVPTADVVLTNPTHYAVALRYTDRPDRAPRVVAKGRNLVAARIRELAEEHKVPVCAAPTLTRAIYFNAEIGAEIPAGLYLAVARILAYVFDLKTKREMGRPIPAFPTDLPIPSGLATEPKGSA